MRQASPKGPVSFSSILKGGKADNEDDDDADDDDGNDADVNNDNALRDDVVMWMM